MRDWSPHALTPHGLDFVEGLIPYAQARFPGLYILPAFANLYADVPFRIEERRARVQRLRDMMDQAEVTASEKYRRVMEAYQGELEFGRTTEAYSETLPTTGQTVDSVCLSSFSQQGSALGIVCRLPWLPAG